MKNIVAVFSMLLGGLLGLGFVLIESTIVENLIRELADIEFQFQLSLTNAIIGVALSVGIGVVAGFIPALMAALMKPVDAIRG